MEGRLFFIGIMMGAFAYATKRFQGAKGLNTALKVGLWHGAFCALSAFSFMLVLVMTFESRAKFISIAANVISTSELYPSLAVALVAGSLGFWRGKSGGAKPSGREHFLSEDLEWAETVFSAVLLAAVLMYFVVQAFKIPSGSMERTLLIGDHLFVNKFLYGLRVPFTGTRLLSLKSVERGDIVVFRFPVDDPRELHCGSIQYGKDFIKRVVGVPGDQIAVKAGRVFRNGEEVKEEPYAQWLDGEHRQPESVRSAQMDKARYQELWQTHSLDRELQEIQKDYFGPVTVPSGAYFVMGDNRDRSCDSRYWGPVETRFLKGRAWFIYWPIDRMRVVR